LSRGLDWPAGRVGSKKLLALDGGGIRALITIEVLARIEQRLQRRLGRDDSFTLAEYFDFIGGTSTGAILAATLASGMRVEQVRRFYEEHGRQMFGRARVLQRFRHRYAHQALADKLKEIFGEDTTLGSERLRTLLLIVVRNARTDSPWPVTNNPQALFNDRSRGDCNLDLPLWQLVRASTAAPTYFSPEVVTLGGQELLFVDGGVTTYNNPAFLLFLMATAAPYRLQWPTGADRLLLVSVGTGRSAAANSDLRPEQMNLLFNAASIPAALIFAAAVEQDLLCRMFGRCLAGEAIDLEVGPLRHPEPTGLPDLFTYLRYDADLSRTGLDRLGLPDIRPRDVQRLDSTAHMADLQRVGRALAERVVDEAHFEGF
jgi:hypothetical protein